jgi:hypothetical protein
MAKVGRRKGQPKTGGRRRGTPNKATSAIREAAQKLLEDKDYQAALKTRLRRGTAGAVEPLLYHYAYGKPKETVAVEAGEIPPFIVRIEDGGSDESTS